jgi:hypothetical protein
MLEILHTQTVVFDLFDDWQIECFMCTRKATLTAGIKVWPKRLLAGEYPGNTRNPLQRLAMARAKIFSQVFCALLFLV